jgi:HlyD family secretion protein
LTRNKKILIGVGIAVVLGGVAYANFRFKRVEGVTVHTETIQKRDLKAIVSASGKIQPKRFVNISADTSGRVTELAVQEGDRVKQGQFLLQIDPRNLRTRVQSGEASLGAARSQLQQMRLSLESAKTALKQAEDAYKRQQNLAKGGLTTKETLERAENDLAMRRAELASQEQNLRTLQLRTEQEQATLENARTDLSKVRIESPIDGIITRRNIEQGETAVVGTMNNAGTVLLQVADMSVIEAEVEVDETDIPNVQLGQMATITVDAINGKTFTAKVTEIGNSPIQATGSAATQATNFKVTLQVEGQIPDVRPGFTCTADITTATRAQALSVPIQATTVREVVLDDKGQVVREAATPGRRPSSTTVQASELKPGQERKELEGVFVVRDGKAVFEPVKTGIAGEKYFEVLSGLKEGDTVIIGPFSSVRELRDGAPVKVEAAPRASTTSSSASR